MFLDNKYTKLYYKLIDRAKQRDIEGYSESHHIIPKSLGGSDRRSNRVNLTAREHFICHLLLTKMTTGTSLTKMGYAIHKMLFARELENRKYTANRSYGMIAYKNAIKNGEISEDVRKIRSNTAKRNWNDPDLRSQMVQSMKEFANTTEGKQLKSSIAKGKNEKKQIAAKSRRWSDETKKKMSETRKRRFAEDPAYKAKILCKLKQFSGERQGM